MNPWIEIAVVLIFVIWAAYENNKTYPQGGGTE
jgi:hypothetical protein